MKVHNEAVEHAANEWLERCSQEAAEPALKAIRAIPMHLVTPTMVASLSACLSSLANGLENGPKDTAQGYLDDCYEDMKRFA